MVTAKAQYNLSNAKRYFSQHLSVGDYYQEGQKTWGQWFGLGAETLGLAGQVKANDFLALCDNRHPQTGQTLTQRQRQVGKDKGREVGVRRVFYNFTFSPPKSVSILAFVAHEPRIPTLWQFGSERTSENRPAVQGVLPKSKKEEEMGTARVTATLKSRNGCKF